VRFYLQRAIDDLHMIFRFFIVYTNYSEQWKYISTKHINLINLGLQDLKNSGTTDSFDLELSALTARLASRSRYEFLLAYQEYMVNSLKPDHEVINNLYPALQSNPIKYNIRDVSRDKFDELAVQIAPLIEGSSALTQQGGLRWQNESGASQDLERLKLVRAYVRENMLNAVGASDRRRRVVT
jgi:transketolase